MWHVEFADLKRNIGFATIISTFVASLLLNVDLGLKLQGPRRPIVGVEEGADVRAIPILDSSSGVTQIRLDKGGPTVLYVMAPDCHWCAVNLANIRALGSQAASRYRFIGLSNTKKGLTEYVAATPLPFAVHAVDMSRLPKGFDPSTTPQMVLVGSDGIVKKVWHGALNAKRKQSVEEYFHVKLPDDPVSNAF